jgi:membrane protease YdiL (CAAX protease family)
LHWRQSRSRPRSSRSSSRITGVEIDYSGYSALRGNLPLVMSLGAGALLSAALGEEIVFRGFLLDQLASLTGKRPWRLAAAVVAAAALFGYAHANQELPGVRLTGTHWSMPGGRSRCIADGADTARSHAILAIPGAIVRGRLPPTGIRRPS